MSFTCRMWIAALLLLLLMQRRARCKPSGGCYNGCFHRWAPPSARCTVQVTDERHCVVVWCVCHGRRPLSVASPYVS